MKFSIIFVLIITAIMTCLTQGHAEKVKVYSTITLQDGVTLKCSDYKYVNCGIYIYGEDCIIEGGTPAHTYACQTNVTIRQ